MTSRVVSRLLAVTGFPGRRRITLQKLRTAVEGIHPTRAERLPGVIPIGYVEGVAS